MLISKPNISNVMQEFANFCALVWVLRISQIFIVIFSGNLIQTVLFDLDLHKYINFDISTIIFDLIDFPKHCNKLISVTRNGFF